VWPLRSEGFKRWLLCELFDSDSGPSEQEKILRFLEASAQVDSNEHMVYTRVGGEDRRFFLDLVNSKWEQVAIDADGWKICQAPNVHFQRFAGMLPLPKPELGGSLDELRPFVNVASDDDFVLLVAWLAAAIKPTGPYPVLVLQGEQGSSKSTTARVLRSLVDPSVAPLRSTPKSERDLVISAVNSWLLVFDNLSGVKPWLADALCRMATGGGFSTRRLYSDSGEILLDVMRPVILNGIDSLAFRQDFLDRSLVLELPPIADSERVTEQRFWQDFERVRPRILGALLTAVSQAMKHLDSLELKRLPRLADFAVFSAALERGLGWARGSFLSAYERNRSNSVQIALDSRPVATALRRLLDTHKSWEGTAATLLDTCDQLVAGSRRGRDWPKSPAALKNELRRLKPGLKCVGIHIEEWRETNRNRDRMLRLWNANVRTVQPEELTSDLDDMDEVDDFLDFENEEVVSWLD